MKLILQIVILSFGLFIVGACNHQPSASVEVTFEEAESSQINEAEPINAKLTPTLTSISNKLAYPEAVIDTKSVMNHAKESTDFNRSLLSVWAGPDGLFIRYIYLR